ncbi:MAG: hypothetical protein ACOX8U_06115 [Bradymonadia bacterium]
MNFISRIIIFLFFCSFAACQKAPAEGLNDCIQLSFGVEMLSESFDSLEEQRLKCEKAEDIEELQRELLIFVKQSSDILAKTDNLYAKHEVACKLSFIYEDKFEECYERVYEPFVQVHSKLIAAFVSMQGKLGERASDNTALEVLVLAMEQFIKELRQALKSQISVCVADFGVLRCQALSRLIDESIPSIKSDAPDKAPIAVGEEPQ